MRFVTLSVLEAKPFRIFKWCVASSCQRGGCWVEKFTRLVVARCLAGSQDASPYGCFSPPAVPTTDSHMRAWLSLHKVRRCVLSSLDQHAGIKRVCSLKERQLVSSMSGNSSRITINNLAINNRCDAFAIKQSLQIVFASLLHGAVLKR